MSRRLHKGRLLADAIARLGLPVVALPMTPREIETMIGARARPDELRAALAELEVPADKEFLRHSTHILVEYMLEAEHPPRDAIDRYLASDPPPTHKAAKLSAWCGAWPELTPEYLPPVIDELATAAAHDEELQWLLEGARRLLARYRETSR
ncbi:MAG: hypothetical protein AAGC55_21675 [Myxococcota bacterium]